MAQARQGSRKRKRSKTALHLWATAGSALAMAGSASANTPAVEAPSRGTETILSLSRKYLTSTSGLFTFLTEKEDLAQT